VPFKKRKTGNAIYFQYDTEEDWDGYWDGLIYDKDQEKSDEKSDDKDKQDSATTGCNTSDWPALYKKAKAAKKVYQDVCIADKIKANRAKVVDLSSKVKYGMYSGKNPVDDKNNLLYPDDAEKEKSKIKRKIIEIIWRELSNEGGVSSINIYDGEIFTWGKGFSGKAHVNHVIKNMETINKDYTARFLGMGIYYDGNGAILVVNTNEGNDYGKVASGPAALSLISSNKQLLSFFIDLGENKNSAQDTMDAQWEVIKNISGSIPDYTHDGIESYKDNWSDGTVALVAHLSHWLPAATWNNSSYKDTKGDALKIVIQFIKLLYMITHKGSNYVIRMSSGGLKFKFGPPFFAHFSSFGEGGGNKGVAAKAIRENGYKCRSIFIETDYNKYEFKDYIFILDDQNDVYYAIPNAINADPLTAKSNIASVFSKIADMKSVYTVLLELFKNTKPANILTTLLYYYTKSTVEDLWSSLDSPSNESETHKKDRENFESTYGVKMKLCVWAAYLMKKNNIGKYAGLKRKRFDKYKEKGVEKLALWTEAETSILKSKEYTELIASDDLKKTIDNYLVRPMTKTIDTSTKK
jgi:hypothetical protein